MADDLHIPESNDEYQNIDQRQYGDESEAGYETTSTFDHSGSVGSQNPWKVMFEDRKKLVFLGIGVILFIILMMSIFGGSDKKKDIVETTVSPEMTLLKDQENKMVKIEDDMQKMALLEKKFSTLAESDRDHLNKLVSQVNILKDELVNIQKQLGDVRKVAYDQQSNIRMLMEKQGSTAAVKKVEKQPVMLPVQSRMTYSIKAIVPGRVWLDSSQGNGVTATVGDHLVGYGVVEKVDARLGQVYTSSGKVITYGENDH